MNTWIMNGRSGDSVWWFPTSRTGRFLWANGTASKPRITVPSDLVEKNTGLTMLRKGARDWYDLSSSDGEGGVNSVSRVSGGGSDSCRNVAAQRCMYSSKAKA